ncbi:disintegrin and metalloproteinase domain-containing protein 11-like isoform X2 [Antedon mediterranea]|uniref:disintegrin and metalloproteinase domain-containing protein 11-like isoform X2 n=1 Tax=Antedon mediterranea TaxID=105859 RepID=UPI003AF6CB46
MTSTPRNGLNQNMKAMDTTWIRFCVLAMMTSVVYSAKHKTDNDYQQLLSKLSSQSDNVSRYIDLSVFLLGQNFSEHKQFIIEAIKHVDQVFQEQLNTSVILSNLQLIPVPASSLESNSNTDTLRELEQLNKISKSDSTFLIRFSSIASVESTFNTMCTSSFTGGVINIEDVGTIARQVMYGLGRNLGFTDTNNLSESCKCGAQEQCLMDDLFSNFSSSDNQTTVSNCNIEAFKHLQNSCLIDQPTWLSDKATCGNGFIETGEQCDCHKGDLECNECLRQSCDVCSSLRCCQDCNFVRKCNSRDCICKSAMGAAAVAAPSACFDQSDSSSAFCGTTQNCSLNTECEIVLCQVEDATYDSESFIVKNVSSTGLKCSNLYAVKSVNDEFFTDNIACKDNGVCKSGKCDTDSCYDRNGKVCSNNGVCSETTKKCLCECNWTGRLCNKPTRRNNCHIIVQHEATKPPPMRPTGVQTTHIIAGFLGILFAAAVISGATSFGYKRLQKRNRLQTKHERNMLSLFEPTREQKIRLARKFNKRTADHDFQYHERIPTDSNVEQRLMDEGMPPPILCTAVKVKSSSSTNSMTGFVSDRDTTNCWRIP